MDYGNYLQRLSGLSEQGRSAAVAGGQFGAQAAQAQGGYAQDVGRANAASIISPALGWNQFNTNVNQALGWATGREYPGTQGQSAGAFR
jgi:hypothetical protein